MDTDFWLQRWRNNEIAFHEGKANALLVAHFNDLSVERGSRVFVPLCGKTRDIPWLLSRGNRVTGIELSELAIEQLFRELGVEPLVSEAGKLKWYSATDIDIFVGDIFELSAETLGPVDTIYDRAALVALPEDMRERYARHVVAITGMAPQLLLTFEYDQSQMDGPPFSVNGSEVSQLYGDSYDLALAESRDVPGGLKGKCAATENAWLLQKSRKGAEGLKFSPSVPTAVPQTASVVEGHGPIGRITRELAILPQFAICNVGQLCLRPVFPICIGWGGACASPGSGGRYRLEPVPGFARK